MTAPTFGVDTLCRHCSGTGERRDDLCPFCAGTGLSSGPQAPVRRDAAETSVAAAASVRRIRESQGVILSILRGYGPLTDEDIWGHVPEGMMSPSGARTRRAELVRAGKVRATGTLKKLATGRFAHVWEAIR